MKPFPFASVVRKPQLARTFGAYGTSVPYATFRTEIVPPCQVTSRSAATPSFPTARSKHTFSKCEQARPPKQDTGAPASSDVYAMGDHTVSAAAR